MQQAQLGHGFVRWWWAILKVVLLLTWPGSVQALLHRGAPSLVPDFVSGQWAWRYGGVDMWAVLAGAPGPAPAAAPAPGPAGAPAGPDPCGALLAAGESGAPGQFLDCQPVRYYGSGAFSNAAPMGCQCGSWSAVCPFQTCDVRQAFEKQCLAPAAAGLGFVALSRNWQPLLPESLPYPMGGFKNHHGVISMCMYWFPDPPRPSFSLPTPKPPPAVPPPPQGPVVEPPPAQSLVNVLPSYANLLFHGVTSTDCMKAITSPMAAEQTKMALLTALGAPGLQILSMDCGSLSVLIEGPEAAVKQAQQAVMAPGFCFSVPGVAKVCMAPLAVPISAPSPAPFGAAPGPAPGR